MITNIRRSSKMGKKIKENIFSTNKNINKDILWFENEGIL